MIRAILNWVGGDLFRAPFVVALCLLMSHWFYFDPKLHSQIDTAENAENAAIAALGAEKTAHAQTSVNHKLAVAEAERLDRANVQRVKVEAATKTQEIVDDLEIRLADARYRADAAEQRLRGQANAAPGRAGSGTAARVPTVSDAATGVGQATRDNRLPAAPITEMSVQERLIATEQALQLDALIQWVATMGLIDVNGAPVATEEPRHGTE